MSSKDIEDYVTKNEEICSLYEGEETDWLADVRKDLADIDPYTSSVLDVEEDFQRLPYTALLPRTFHNLHTCVLNRRWLEAVRILQKIIDIPVNTSPTIWKVGKELIEQERVHTDRLLKDLHNLVKGLGDMNHQEVILEYVMYLLSTGDTKAAIETITERFRRSGRKRVQTSRDRYINTLFRLNKGLLWYLEWEVCGSKLRKHNRSDGSHTTSLSQVTSLEMQMNNYAVKALKCFQGLQNVNGVWDIFIEKYVKLLVYCDQTVEALEVLQHYSEKNGNNPNAQKFLYHFYKEHFPDSENVVKQLKIVADLIPSDSLVLELCETLKKDRGVVLRYLFDLLDNTCWQTKEQPWQILAEVLCGLCLDNLEEISVVITELKTSWSVRHSWWPHYHFHKYQVVKRPGAAINYHKSLVVSCLCGPDFSFCTEAQNYFTDGQTADFMEFKKKFKTFRQTVNILPT